MAKLSLFPPHPRPLLFAHRGYSTRAPENSLAAFREAARAGIPGIELDIHRCASGELVVAHDSDLYRVSGTRMVIEDSPLSVIRGLDIASGFRRRIADGVGHDPASAPDIIPPAQVPLLSELFEEFGSSFYYDIEIKHFPRVTGTVVRLLAGLIRQFGLGGQCLVSSFNPFAVRSFKQIEPGIPTAVIYCRDPELPFWLRRGEGRYVSGCDVLKPQDASVTEALLRPDGNGNRLPVICWTVDSVEDAVALVERGVDGIISNDPEPIQAAMRVRGTPVGGSGQALRPRR